MGATCSGPPLALRIGRVAMTDPIHFAKLSGSGNDFVCIDSRDGRHGALLASPRRVGQFARVVCRRRLGVGADGVVFATACPDPAEADVGARHFEPDGSEAELCGNGTACFAAWAIANAWVPANEIRIHTPSGMVRGRGGPGQYMHVCIPEPHDLATDVEFALDGSRWTGDFAITGVPHLVVYVDDVDRVDVARLGPAIRHHERFAPRGVNVNFTQVLGQGELAVRTFEFGVEDETLACGTGCSTAAAAAAFRLGWPRDYLDQGEPIRIHVRSGDVLKVYLLVDERCVFTKVCLETIVRPMYHGTLHPSLVAQALGQGAG